MASYKTLPKGHCLLHGHVFCTGHGRLRHRSNLGFYALPQFRERFGIELPAGSFQITSAWQSGLANGAQIGQLAGLMIAGLLAERYGYKKTILGALFIMICVVFLFFFAQSIGMLFAAEVLAGLPWGAFQTLTTTYAADITPVQLRPILTTYVNMCWVVGQLISSGVLRGFLSGTDNWAWRIPYALQWAFPIPVIIGALLAPESPYWCVRHVHPELARKSLRSLASRGISDEHIDNILAMIAHTNELEKYSQAGTSYIDCFKGTNLRRTEIAVMAWVSQVFCGVWFGGSVTYFMQQAGLSNANAFNLGIGNNCLALIATMCAWFVMTRVGRRTLYLFGLSTCFTLVIVVGFMGIPAPTAALGWASGAILMCFVVTYDLTIGPICYCLVAEIPSTRLRIKTACLARNAYNIASIGANFLNPPILNPASWNLRGKGGFVWCGFCFISLTWSFFRLPEPKGLTPAELDIIFENHIPQGSSRPSKQIPSAQSIWSLLT